MIRTPVRGRLVAALLVVLPIETALAQAPSGGDTHGTQGGPTSGTGAATTPPATPDADPAVAEARRRYAQGAEFYRRGRYSEAVAEFTEAYSQWQNPTILYALGQAFEGLSEVNRAIETYRRYLETAPANDARRPDVEAKIAELERLLATVHIQCNVLAAIYVDGEQSGDAPGNIRLATGRHEIELRAEGFESSSQTVTVAGGTERTMSFHLEPVPAATQQVVRVESPPFRFPRPVFFTAAAITGAGVVTWVSLASLTVARANQYNDTVDRTNLQRDRARQIARDSNVALGITGGVAAVTAVIGIFTQWHARPDEEPPPVTAGVDPVVGGAILNARWTR